MQKSRRLFFAFAAATALGATTLLTGCHHWLIVRRLRGAVVPAAVRAVPADPVPVLADAPVPVSVRVPVEGALL